MIVALKKPSIGGNAPVADDSAATLGTQPLSEVEISALSAKRDL
jgi:hypothetical protein